MSYHPISRAGVDAAEPLTFAEKRITLSTQVQHRNRVFTITFQGYTIDQAADLLDRKFGNSSYQNGKEHTAPASPQPSDTPPACPIHQRKMKPMNFADKQGRTWMCTAKIGDGWCNERA